MPKSIDKSICPNCKKEITPIVIQRRKVKDYSYKDPLNYPLIYLWILGCPECNIIFYKEILERMVKEKIKEKKEVKKELKWRGFDKSVYERFDKH
jgi:hypothetical protein